MPENTQRVSVGGFSFENKDEAEQAKKEIEGIRYIKTKTDMNDPEVRNCLKQQSDTVI